MKTTSKLLCLLLATGLLLPSCRKQLIKGSDKGLLLTQQSWSYELFGIDENLDGQIDIPDTFEDCAKDDLVKFNGDGSGDFNQGVNLCYPGFPQTQGFDWQFHNNETQLEYGGAIHNIISLTETQLAIYTEENTGSSVVRHILVYKR